ncbi:hypothetical protein HK097_011421 [Rhizophlyctis rosea]|uniref:F-box domain-containing protein n=1 Tax=Rhizophlyctis rosea TaxID=64517 RepID=A0AAD5S6F2_9FUNG|nr:hypothetical protein HK097_011421 [Rhizophlyctis rosea]
MTIPDLNNDCWTQVTFYLAGTSIGELLKCGTLSRRFRYLVDTNPFWPSLGKRLSIGPPSPRARKYKTWKSLAMQKRGAFCERCFGTTARQKRKLYIFTEHQPVVVFVCKYCHSQYQPSETILFRRANRERLTQELEKLAIFEGRNIEDVLKEDTPNVSDTVVEWLKGGPNTNLAPQMALKFAELAERRAIVRQRFPEEEREYRVQIWVIIGRGDLDTIVQAVRERRDRRALAVQQFAEFETADPVSSWISSGNGDIEQIVQLLRTEGDRRTELKDKLAGVGLSLSEDVSICGAYIRKAVGNIDEIVNCVQEFEWFCRCTEFANYHWSRYDNASDRQKLRALALWVRGTIPKDAKSLDDFLQTDSPNVPPDCLHAKINNIIRILNKVAQMAAANKARSRY